MIFGIDTGGVPVEFPIGLLNSQSTLAALFLYKVVSIYQLCYGWIVCTRLHFYGLRNL